ncbi:MAG: sigma-70 family RNA polymerase sigma factor [Archangium sp.]|nr:sigma-70 family RNA polymerase sigma factor [Archangium sp.]
MAWDQAFLQKFRSGEATAMAEVYRQHVPSLHRLLRAAAFRGPLFSSLRAPSELENTLLEVFARAFEPRAREAYDGVRPYEAFLMGIARNVLLENARRREDSVGGELTEVVDTALADDLTDVQALLEDREVTRLLETFRRELNGENAQLYELRFVEGLSQEQAAERMGQTRIQLRRREHKLRTSLLAWLKQHGYLTELTQSGWGFVKSGDEGRA